MVLGADEELTVPTKFSIAGVITALDGCVSERPVRSLELTVRRTNSLLDCSLILRTLRGWVAWSGDAQCSFSSSVRIST